MEEYMSFPSYNSRHSIGASKKKIQCTRSEATQCEDRISNLPESVLAYILSFLTMNEAVLTGILSKRWGYLWTKVQRLSYFGPKEHIPCDIDAFVSFISNTISLIERSTVDEFALALPLYEPSPLNISEEDKKATRVLTAKVDLCIHFAVQRKAKILHICFDTYANDATPDYAHYKLPSYFYSNEFIQDLRLDYCIIDHAKRFLWKLLHKIVLRCIKLGDEVMKNILTGSPLLEYLYLVDCTGLNTLSITSHKLKDLGVLLCSGSKIRVTGTYIQKIAIGGDLSGFDLTGLAFAVRIGVFGSKKVDDDLIFTMNRLVVDYIGHVQYATFNDRNIKVFSALELKDQHSLSMNCIGFRLIINLDKWDLPGVVALLRASANLQILVLWVDHSDKQYLSDDFVQQYDFDETDYFTTLLHPPSLTNLRTVKTYGFHGKTSEILLLEFLLKSAVSLQNMEIFCGKKCNFASQGMRQLTQMLISVRRASPVAVVSFP